MRDQLERIAWTVAEVILALVSAPAVATLLVSAGVPENLWGITTVGLTPILAGLFAWAKTAVARRVGSPSAALWPNAGESTE